ncbi:hypothetical protein C8Q76DRAFT_789526 [Earliella scabrosa]|nr:hypothetical protein C8Q76DRAFT_789526 [Earliella scabrosa]
MHSNLSAKMQALSIDDATARHKPVPSSSEKTRPAQVDCFPLPPLDEYWKPKATGVYYYAIYVRKGALEAYAQRVNPEAATHPPSVQRFYALDHLRWVVGDRTLDIQVAVLRERHRLRLRDADVVVEERGAVRVLCLFRFDTEEGALERRMEAEKVERLVDALGCRPDWFEILFFS